MVGLGNPGEGYAKTRHNLGFRVVDELGSRVKGTGFSWKDEERFKSEILTYTLDPIGYTLVKPQTFMNNSGEAVKSLTLYYKLHASDLIVIHDDLDLPLGKIQVRKGGTAAGHHGVESVISSLGTDQFIRVRVGIGSSVGEADKFVLQTFTKQEQEQVETVIQKAAQAVEFLLEQGVEATQNQFNG